MMKCFNYIQGLKLVVVAILFSGWNIYPLCNAFHHSVFSRKNQSRLKQGLRANQRPSDAQPGPIEHAPHSEPMSRRRSVEIVSTLIGMNVAAVPCSAVDAAEEETRAIATPFKVVLTVQLDPKSQSTSQIEIEVRPDWAPIASARFRELVESGFYNDARFFRVLPGYVAQFGIAADPSLNKEWMFCEKNCKALPDEPRKEKNKRGTLSFASSGKNSRQTQVFINLGNNDGPPNFLDGQGFVPFAKVSNGMDDVVKKLNSEYGMKESISGGLTGSVNQGKAAYYGAEYLDTLFPKLSIIKRAEVI